MNSPYPEVAIGSLASPEKGSFKIGPFGSSLKKAELVEDGIPVVGIENVLPNQFMPSFRKFITLDKFKQLSQYKIEPFDILVTTMGTIGRSVVAPQNIGNAIIDSHLFRMRVDRSKVEPAYLCYALNGFAPLKKQIENKSVGAIMAGLNTTILKECTIPLPPLEEQKRIAALLDEQMRHIEHARLAAEESLSAAWELPSAYLMEVFEGKEAKKWGNQKLGEVSKIVGGVQKTPDRTPTNFHKPYLTVRNVQKGYLDLSQVERFEVTPNEFERCKLKQGDILIVEGNGSIDHIGRNALFELPEDDWIHQNHIIRVRLNSSFNPKFVSLFLNSPLGRSQMIEKAETTSGLYTLSSGKVASLEIPIPSLDEQQKIVDGLNKKLAATNEMQTSLESQLAEIESLPSAVLGQAFAGQL